MKPPKVLQIVGTLDRWSVEIWLLRMLAHARSSGAPVDWTFYCTFAEEGARADEARALGATVIRSPTQIGRKAPFVAALRGEIARGGYDVVHSHHDLISGIYLAAAIGLPLRRRLVHVHNADESMLTPSRLKQALMRPTLRRTCLALADRIVANSEHSLDVFLAGRRPRPGRDLVHYLGIDAEPFRSAMGARAAFRRGLRVPPETPILLFAGRMTPEKNPVFAVDVLAAIRRSRPEVRAVFVGDGSLEPDVRARVAALGQEDAVSFLGWREDVPEIMSCCDWFILPHPEEPMEGFGIAVVEAQLAGLRLLLSRGVGDAPLLPTAAFRRLSLLQPAEAWAKAAIDLWEEAVPSRTAAFAAFDGSPMQMDRALADLLSLYE